LGNSLPPLRHLKAESVDDALDLLMTTELLGRAQRESDKENARRHPRLARASARLAVAVEALFESDGWGGPGEEPRVSEVWLARGAARPLPGRVRFLKMLPGVIEFGASARRCSRRCGRCPTS
jgi:hypothetical protein